MDKGYVFSKDVEYYSSEIHQSIADVAFEEIEYLKDVQPGAVIAKIPGKAKSGKAEKDVPLNCYTDSYLKSCNVTITAKEKGDTVFTASVKGKVVLFKGLPYVVAGDIDGSCAIYISADGMSVTADIIPAKGAGRKITGVDVFSKLTEKKIIHGILEKTIAESVLTADQTGFTHCGIIIAQGKPPVDGNDAKITFHFSTEPIFEDFKILPDGRVDYRKQVTIEMVKKGALLAEVGAREKGIDGKNVFGQTLPAKEGAAQIIFAGANVEKSADGARFFSQIDGQAALNKNILNVFPHYTVPGDVDFNSGNIQFDGNVTVNGNVTPGFEVKATGDIVVMKMVDCGILDAGRDIKVLGGIIGNNENLIQCGRNLYSSHVQNAFIEAQGDVVLKDSAVHSQIFSTGSIVLREGKGTISGGTTHALRWVEAKVIGSTYGTKTEIVVGQDFFIRKMLDKLFTFREFCRSNIEKIEKYLKPLFGLLKDGEALPEKHKAKMTPVLKKYKELKNYAALTEAKVIELKKNAAAVRNAQIKVSQTLHANVKMTIYELSTNITEEQNRVCYRYDAKKDHIVKGAV